MSCGTCRAIYRSGFSRCPADGTELRPFDVDPMIGITLAQHYVIEACIGEGAMGRVYRAHHARLERKQFAIKVLLGDLAADPTMRKRFAQEADAASRLDHPNVVGILDYGETDEGLLYIVMDLVSGENLADVIERDGAMSEERVLDIARPLCRGLAHAHERDLVHRDFKPDNVVMIDGRDGPTPRILDFGLAIIADPEEASTRLTQAGLVMGTPAYTSPEQAMAKPLDHRTDLFALGVSLYEMLAGQLPFDGSVMEIVYANARDPVPPIAERTPGTSVSPELEAIVMKLMAKQAEDRFASAREVLDALDLVPGAAGVSRRASSVGSAPTALAMDQLHGAASSEQAIETQAIAKPTGRGALLGVALLAAAVAAAAVYWFTMRNDPKPQASNAIAAQGSGDGEAEAADRGTAKSVDPEAEAKPEPDPEPKADPEPEPEPKADPEPEPAPETDSPDPKTTTPESESKADRKRRSRRSRRDRRRSGRDHKTTSPDPEPVAAPPKPVVEPPKPKPEPDPPKPEPVAKPNPKPDPPKPKPVAKPKPKPALDASASITGFSARGSLSRTVVRRAVNRVSSSFRGCYRSAARRANRDAAGSAKVSFKIDESGRARSVSVSSAPLPGISGCVQSALSRVRTRIAPDVGTVRVSFKIRFTPRKP